MNSVLISVLGYRCVTVSLWLDVQAPHILSLSALQKDVVPVTIR